MNVLFEFDQGTIDLESQGQCLTFTYSNIEGPGTPPYAFDFEGHSLVVMSFVDAPDRFRVLPDAGWEAVTPNPILVEEWTKGFITICQMLLG